MIEKPGEGPLTPAWGGKAVGTYVPPQPKPSVYAPAEWKCLGVIAKTLKLHGSEHEMPAGSKPEQPTTDETGKWMTGYCRECEHRTVWKALS